MEAICFYEDQYYLFSNFSAHSVFYDENLYPTAEHAYQASKFASLTTKEGIRMAASPEVAKDLAHNKHGKDIIGRKDDEKIRIMEDIIRAKVEQHTIVKARLLESVGRDIYENSPDNYFWGCGADKTGSNHIGRILMIIRDEIK